MFVNPQVPPDALPRAEQLDWQALHPRFVRRLQLGTLIRFSVFAGIGGGVHYALATGGLAALFRAAPWLPVIAWSVFAALSFWALAWPAIAVPRHGYAVRDRDILYRSGVLWRSVRAIPFNRVQHTKTDSTPLDRRFGLANLSVFPAGGGGHKIRGLGRETAERLRAYVSARIEAESDRGTDPDFGEPA
ncbi:MAG: PH domain-containing protein [Gemmatimonadota bacterium]|nr:PH domain-containing protein [Gemmatimonadota bacterium]MDE2864275.1 PH domain-containing protein [Gemmatimonadota bacterium]MYB06659.1 PH domain-containing protein [Gemmatimonadota bacterium]MYG23572.1 PH domain-containing protein [Gemmatimonadota bacterium]MYJ38811.1 PH domain-containing protein [Gemmatimonadota bacterium]